MVPKFRAWDKENEIYLYNVQDAYDTLSGFVKYADGENADYDESCFGDFLTNKRYDVEQFIGLKDANGKEIYEGDILATSSMVCGSHVTDYLKVDWREDYAGFFCGETPLFACLSEWDNDIKYPQTFPEIVGNVHTNPELLEAGTND